MLHRGGKCNFKILNVIKLENPTSMCIIQCKEKYIIVRTKYRGENNRRWPELIQSETDELELKI